MNLSSVLLALLAASTAYGAAVSHEGRNEQQAAASTSKGIVVEVEAVAYHKDGQREYNFLIAEASVGNPGMRCVFELV
jgi:hypothetical protein